MRIAWLKKGIAISLIVLGLSGCEFSLKNLFGEDEKTNPDNEEQSTEQETETTKPSTEIAPYYASGDIDYYSSPKKLDNSFLDKIEKPGTKNLKETIAVNYMQVMGNGVFPETPLTWADIDHFFRFYEVGTIKSETYKNQKLVVLNLECDGMCMKPQIYRFAYDSDKNTLTYLKRMSSEYEADLMAPLTWLWSNNSILYKGIEPPEEINIPGTDKKMNLEEKYMNHFVDVELWNMNKEYLFTDPEYGKAYTFPDVMFGCVYLESPDGTSSLYSYNPHFFDSEDVYAIWDDGSEKTNITEKYTFASGGCGIRGNCYLITPKVNEDFLEKVGKTSNGIDLYTVKNPTEVNAENQAQIDFVTSYESYKSYASFQENDGIPPSFKTFDEFVAAKPVLYWKDFLGNWTYIILTEIKPPAECGKPVIYLYPEKTTDVSVQVDVDKFTKTIPEYGRTGWTVKASPDGSLYNYTDGKTYPYLFWEGQDNDGMTLTKGFSVKRENLDKFLSTSLSKLGLNSQEIKDFKEFWVKRMLDNKEPYFLISFLGTNEFNKIAPLSITPVPTTLIRVFMYYQPMTVESKLPEQKLSSIERKGFTVIEWGGTSSRPWQE